MLVFVLWFVCYVCVVSSDVCGLLFVGCCALFVLCVLYRFYDSWGSLRVVRCMLFVVCCSLCVACCLMRDGCCVLYVSFVVCRLFCVVALSSLFVVGVSLCVVARW